MSILSPHSARELRRIIKESTGRDISLGEAYAIWHYLIKLLQLLWRVEIRKEVLLHPLQLNLFGSDAKRLKFLSRYNQEMSKLPSKPKDSRGWRDSYYHKMLGLKAANEVQRFLPLFEKELPSDKRPRQAVQALKEWSQGKRTLGMAEVRKLSLGAHAAAKVAKSDVAKAVAHAAGQAVGTWHVPTHALGAFGYAGRVRGMIAKRKKS